MDNEKNIIITNGVGTSNVVSGNYNVTATVSGYDNSSIKPTSVEVVDGTLNYNFTIEADGTLTLHVTDGSQTRITPIVGATFIRCDSTGNTTYGSEVTSGAEGNAVFEKVPYVAGTGYNFYYKQTASDGEHEFSTDVVSLTLTEQVTTSEVINNTPSLKTFNLTDLNYNDLGVRETINLNS